MRQPTLFSFWSPVEGKTQRLSPVNVNASCKALSKMPIRRNSVIYTPNNINSIMASTLTNVTAEHCTGITAATKAIFNCETLLLQDPRMVPAYAAHLLDVHLIDEEKQIFFDFRRTKEHNMALANLLRQIANKYEWLKAWTIFSELCTDSGLHPLLMKDMQICRIVHSTIPPNRWPSSAPSCSSSSLSLTIISHASTPNNPNITHLGPKTIGGTSWKTSDRYKKIFKDWNGPRGIPMGPCPFYACTGVAKQLDGLKEVEGEVVECVWLSQLLGVVVDYDLDLDSEEIENKVSRDEKRKSQVKTENNGWGKKDIKGAVRSVAEMAVRSGVDGVDKGLRGAAWCGLMCLEQQLFNRARQARGIAENNGSSSANDSPSNSPRLNSHNSSTRLPTSMHGYTNSKTKEAQQISPYEFAVTAYADCAALAAFGYQSASQHARSRKGMLIAVLMGNLFDLIYDRGSHSRISCLGYAMDAGTLNVDALQALAVGVLDQVANECVSGMTGDGEANEESGAKMCYGDMSLFTGTTWSLFNVRYRAWERMIKYLRILLRSDSPEANRILGGMLEDHVIIPPLDQELEGLFEIGLDARALDHAVSRSTYTHTYYLSDPSQVLLRHDLRAPEGLCHQCLPGFTAALNYAYDTIQAVPGIPQSCVESEAVAIAAAISRGSRWAVLDECCDKCACIIGAWANVTSEKAILRVMEEESMATVHTVVSSELGGLDSEFSYLGVLVEEGTDHYHSDEEGFTEYPTANLSEPSHHGARNAKTTKEAKKMKVLREEGKTYQARHWLLTNYVMGCVALSPLRLVSVLGEFDAVCRIEVEEGSMGGRDCVDA